MYNKKTFAYQLKQLLISKGLTQRDLADKLATTEATISRYVAGARTPSIEIAVDIADILGVSMNELVGVDAPAVPRRSPDFGILVSCYERASDDQRDALWGILNSYGLLTPEQKALIEAMKQEGASDVV